MHLSVSSHRLVLLPRPLEVDAAVFSALDDRPSTAGCFHLAVHLRRRQEIQKRRLQNTMHEGDETLMTPTGLCIVRRCNVTKLMNSTLQLSAAFTSNKGVIWMIVWFFPSFHDESSLGIQYIYVLFKLNQHPLIPQQLPRDVPHQFLQNQSGGPGWTHTSGHLGETWPLTPDLGVRKLIMQCWHSICSVSLCFKEDTPGEGLSPQSDHTAEHTRTQPGYN